MGAGADVGGPAGSQTRPTSTRTDGGGHAGPAQRDRALLRHRGDRSATGPTLVALHGGPGFDHAYLRPGLDPVAAWARVVYVDLRGQGRSGRPPLATCTLEQMADDVAALCRQLGIDRPVVFGHSAGGFVALHLAVRHPGLAGGLILAHTAPTLAPLPDGDPPPSLAERAGPEAVEVAARLFGGDMSQATLEAFGRLVAPCYAAPSHPEVPERLFALSGFEPEVARYFFGTLAPAYDLRPHLGEIDVPTLVVTGRWDWVCPPAAGRAIAAGIPGAALVELPDGGHFGFTEEPARFQHAVRVFLGQPVLVGRT
jgi:proline iminopeptidase